MSAALILSLAGLVVLVLRLRPWKRPPTTTVPVQGKVSIIVPCRNEELNIGPLLESLLKEEGLAFEIIVVDDDSRDATSAVARCFPKTCVFHTAPRPPGWTGKNWACWQGALMADGDILLFTDADTRHRPGSLGQAVHHLKAKHLDLMTAPPHHVAQGAHRFLGPFFLMPLIATAFRAKPQGHRTYAIGQYLMTTKAAYFESGGHRAIAADLAEDIGLAKLFMAQGRAFGVFPTASLYQVSIYGTWPVFLREWKRLFRLGMRRTSWISFAEVFLVLHLFTNLNLALVAGVLVLALAQRQHGSFSAWGALLAPVNAILFIALSLAGAYESMRSKKVVWHGRAYSEN